MFLLFSQALMGCKSDLTSSVFVSFHITHTITSVSFFDPQYLQDLDEEVAEMTKKKQRDCEVGLVISPRLTSYNMCLTPVFTHVSVLLMYLQTSC